MNNSSLLADLDDAADAPFSLPIRHLSIGDFYRLQPDAKSVNQILAIERTHRDRGRRSSGRKPTFYRVAVHGGEDDGAPTVTAFVRPDTMPLYPVSASEAGDAIRTAVQKKVRQHRSTPASARAATNNPTK